MSDMEKALARLRSSSTSDFEDNSNGGGGSGPGVERSAHELARRSETVSSSAATTPSIPSEIAPRETVDQPERTVRSANKRLSIESRGARKQTNTVVRDAPFRVANQPVDDDSATSDENHGRVFELPLSDLLNNGFLVPGTPKGRLTEEYRRIKRPLLRNIRKDPPIENSNIIMVTSSVSNEGKTYTSVNLAMSFARERERTVLLIDGDVIKGSAGRVLGIDPTAMGLTNLLSGDCAVIGDAILPTNVNGLSFLPSGTEHELANELLSSEIMSESIRELANRYDDRIIIIDSPPILQTNEANTISEYAGQVVFVVAEASTPQRLVKQALAHIDEEKYVGILINKSSSAGRSYAYGYDYGYE